MLISLKRNGGFAGITKLMEIDTTKLPQKEQEKLSMLLETANFFNLPAYIAEPLQRDRFEYTLSVQDKNKQHTVTVSESAIPEDLKPLIEWITDNC